MRKDLTDEPRVIEISFLYTDAQANTKQLASQQICGEYLCWNYKADLHTIYVVKVEDITLGKITSQNPRGRPTRGDRNICQGKLRAINLKQYLYDFAKI